MVPRQAAYTLPDYAVIVDHQDLHCAAIPCANSMSSSLGKGRRAVTTTPNRSLRFSTVRVPPSSVARSFIPIKPNPPEGIVGIEAAAIVRHPRDKESRGRMFLR